MFEWVLPLIDFLLFLTCTVGGFLVAFGAPIALVITLIFYTNKLITED